MKKNNNMTRTEFSGLYSTEEQCERKLFEDKWPDGFVCPACGGKEHCTISTRRHKLYQCKECGHQTTVAAGTMFESSKVPFTKWFMAIYEFSNDKRGYSAKRLESEVGVNYKTAGLMLHKIRKAMGDRDSDGNHLLGGVVEVDEFYSGATDEGGKHGRGTDKSKVILAVSTTADKKHTLAMRARVEQELSGETAKAFMESNIKRGSPVETDGLSIYNGLSAIGYDHRPRIHDPKGSDLYWMHIVISNIKSFVQGTFHGLDEKYLQRYLDEFTYRFNRRLPGGAILGRLIKSCVMANHMTCSELKG